MSIIKRFFGKTKDNIDVYLLYFTNTNGMKIKIITYGATIVSIIVPNKKEDFTDVVLGYDTIEAYENENCYLGALIGRFANRIENGKFKINNIEYSLVQNSGNNHIHGGIKGFDKIVWNIETIDNRNNSLVLSYLSKDGEESYPGNLNVTVTYTLTNKDELIINYKAKSDKDTIVNLTNHSYFNLGGQTQETALNQKLMLNSDEFTENNKYSIPTGNIISVEGTPMDFRNLKTIGEEINSDYYQIKLASGYDHNWILKSGGNINELAAKLVDESTGIIMDMYTTKPGVQFYSANFLSSDHAGKNGTLYEKRSALCLETQYFPNSINNKNFPSPLLKAEKEYNHTTIYKFSLK